MRNIVTVILTFIMQYLFLNFVCWVIKFIIVHSTGSGYYSKPAFNRLVAGLKFDSGFVNT